jgi:tetratricopeptide (TPR) repeat protein
MLALPLAWVVKGVAYHGLGRYAEALSCFDWAFRLNPPNRETVDLWTKTCEYMEEELGESAG